MDKHAKLIESFLRAKLKWGDKKWG